MRLDHQRIANRRSGVLKELAPYNWAPTFAFVDPNGPDVHWSSLRALARFKKANLTKPELWVLLAAGMFIGNLPVNGRVRPQHASKLTRMYGTEQWEETYQARVDGTLRPADAQEEYVNLMRWRLEHVLGYRWTHPLEIFNERGHSIAPRNIDGTSRPLTTLAQVSGLPV